MWHNPDMKLDGKNGAHDTTQRGGEGEPLVPTWERPPLGQSMALDRIHVWRADLDRFVLEPTAIAPEERIHAQGIPHNTHRQRYLAGRCFRRRVLARYLGIPPGMLRFEIGPSGKPHLPEPSPLQFNLSHSGPLALLAVSQKRAIGIDLEPIRPRQNLLAIARRVLEASVAKRLAAIDDETERLLDFTRAWTRFEARQKMTGQGIFGNKAVPPHRLTAFTPAAGWLGALAIAGDEIAPLRFFEAKSA